ncbi:MAG: hypothetical protein CSA62_01780 [Planctomycetota bacterium]|nr:MAG: hypothetical protein CSA62_01780 [Planctomycetota bacterium]
MESKSEAELQTPIAASDARVWPQRLGLLGVLALLELLAIFYQPQLSYPDELSHVQHAAYLAMHSAMPEPYAHAQAWERDGKSPVPASAEYKVQQDKHPPYVYVAGALLLKASDQLYEGAGELVLPGDFDVRIDLDKSLAPLPYLLGQILWLRGFCALHWLAAGFAFLLLMERLVPGRAGLGFALALGAATIPQALLGGVAFTPDTPLVCFCAWSFLFLVRAAAGLGSERKLGLFVGLFFALALLSKSAAIYLGPLLLLAAWQRARVLGDRGAALRFLLWSLLLPVLLASWWYLRNFWLYGDLFQMQAQVETFSHSIRRTPLTPLFFEVLIEDLFRTFFGFGTVDELLPRPFFLIYAAVGGMLLLGLVRLLRVQALWRRASPELRAALPLSLLGAAVMLVLAILGNLTIPSAQGRYLYPVIPAFAVITAAGIQGLIRPRSKPSRWLPYAAVLVWILSGVFAFRYSVLPRHFPERARAQGETGVYHYVDCGSPGSLDRFVRSGIALPDTGQKGRIQPWRSLRADPVAVIYELPRPKSFEQLQLRLMLFNPDLSLPFSAEAAGRFRYPSQSIWVNGRQLAAGIEVSGRPRELIYPLSRSWLGEGPIRLELRRESGNYAMLSEIWLEEAWLVQGVGEVHNRSSRPLPYRVSVPKAPSPSAASDQVIERIVQPGETWPDPGSAQREMLKDRVKPDSRYDLRELSPWRVLEAEGHPAPGRYWFGNLEASGGYFVRGNGPLVQIAADLLPDRPLAVLGRISGADGFSLKSLGLMPAKGSESWTLSTKNEKVEELDLLIICQPLR